jgi:hypothetical protein
MHCFNLLGLILNTLGAIFVAASVSRFKTPSAAPYTTDEKGKKIYIAYVNHPVLLKIGLVLIVLGFIFQAIAAL